MKIAILSIGLSVVLMVTAGAQTNLVPSTAVDTNNLPPDVLVTKLGEVYDQYRVVKKDPAGLIIRYVPEGGGIGMEKIPFAALPDDWQQRYNFDPQKATQFELAQKRAMAYWREKMIADEQANREKWARLAAEEEAERQAKLNAQAAAAAGTNAPTMLATNLPAMTDTNAPAMSNTNLPPTSSPGG